MACFNLATQRQANSSPSCFPGMRNTSWVAAVPKPRVDRSNYQSAVLGLQSIQRWLFWIPTLVQKLAIIPLSCPSPSRAAPQPGGLQHTIHNPKHPRTPNVSSLPPRHLKPLTGTVAWIPSALVHSSQRLPLCSMPLQPFCKRQACLHSSIGSPEKWKPNRGVWNKMFETYRDQHVFKKI